MSSSFLKKKGEKIKTRQGPKGILANHRPWGVTDNQKGRSDRLTISSKKPSKETKEIFQMKKQAMLEYHLG
jgi:hypothetical protein